MISNVLGQNSICNCACNITTFCFLLGKFTKLFLKNVINRPMLGNEVHLNFYHVENNRPFDVCMNLKLLCIHGTKIRVFSPNPNILTLYTVALEHRQNIRIYVNDKFTSFLKEHNDEIIVL